MSLDYIDFDTANAFRGSPGETLSGKSRKADDLRAKGQPIELLGEPDFVRRLEL